MKILPQQSRVVVEPIEAADSELVIPNSKDDEGQVRVFKRLRVVEVGTGRILDSGVVIEMGVKVGDEVVVDTRYAHPLQPAIWYGDRELYVIDYAGVLAKIEREPGEDVVTHKPAKQSIVAPSKKILVPAC